MMRTEPLGSARNPTVDHIVARSRGGDGYPENLRVICRGCNSKKGAA
jgi:5-methylcytosine-specific restriction endonuclease McrA